MPGRAEPRPPGGGRLRIRALAAALAICVALAVPLVRGRIAQRTADLRATAVSDSLGAAKAVAGAMETYEIERGVLPASTSANALADALAPFLPWPILADSAVHPFAYNRLPDGYVLRFTPAEGGVPVLLQVTLGVGGSAVAANSRTAIGW